MKVVSIFLSSTILLISCGGGTDDSEQSIVKAEVNIDEQIHNVVPTVDYQSLSDTLLFDFEHNSLGEYTEDMFDTDFDNRWERIDGIAEIVSIDDNKKLGITIPAGQAKKGIAAGKNLDEYQELYFSYQISFSKDYDFSKGGKILGLGGLNFNLKNVSGSQITPSGCEAVGQQSNEGFSLRSMFRDNGRAIGYFYHQNNPNLDLDPSDGKYNCGEEITYRYNDKDFSFRTEKTYLIEQYVKINTVNQSDGIVRIHVNGHQVLERADMTFSENGNYGINQLFFDFWHGGSTDDWAPNVDSTAIIDNVTLGSIPVSY